MGCFSRRCPGRDRSPPTRSATPCSRSWARRTGCPRPGSGGTHDARKPVGRPSLREGAADGLPVGILRRTVRSARAVRPPFAGLPWPDTRLFVTTRWLNLRSLTLVCLTAAALIFAGWVSLEPTWFGELFTSRQRLLPAAGF